MYYTRQTHFLLSAKILYLGKINCMAKTKKNHLEYNRVVYNLPSE